MKKLLALTLCAVLLLSAIPAAGAADFSDSAAVSQTAAEAVDVTSDLGIVTGFPDGSFKPEETLTRAQAAKIICCATLGTKAADALQAGGSTFSDVPASHWANKFVEHCASKGVVSGVGGGRFDPDGKLTGDAFGKMLLAALGADTSSLTGASWGKNTRTMLRERHLDYGVTVGARELSRQDACRLALNALFDGEKGGADKTLASKVFGVTRKTDGTYDDEYRRPYVYYTAAADAYWKGTEKKLTASPVHVLRTGKLTGGDVVEIYAVERFSNTKQLTVFRNGADASVTAIKDVFKTGNSTAYSSSGNSIRLEFYYCADRDQYVIIHQFPLAEPIKSVSGGVVTFASGLSFQTDLFTEADVGSYALYYGVGKETMNVAEKILRVERGTILIGSLTAFDLTGRQLAVDGKSYEFCTLLGNTDIVSTYIRDGGCIGDIVHVLLTPEGYVAAVWQ